MARISGIDLPKNKRVEVALTYIYGIGRKTASNLCTDLKIDETLRVHQLDETTISSIRTYIDEKLTVEGEAKRIVSLSIKRLQDIKSYRGLRHRLGLPVRGQTTRVNARTRKGRKKTVANKKKAVR